MISKEMLIHAIKTRGRCDFSIPCKEHCRECELLKEGYSDGDTYVSYDMEDPVVYNNEIRIWKEQEYTLEELFEILL